MTTCDPHDDVDKTTIYALASGQGTAAIAIVRLSGPRAIVTVERLAGRSLTPRRASLAKLRSPTDGALLDVAVTVTFPGPQSYTGEDIVELHLHGGRAVVDGVLATLGALPGLRMAEPGEFTRRAFQNGRMDLTEIEALGDLLAARTERQRQQALANVTGHQRQVYESWRSRLIAAMARVEAELDFSDEGDVEASSLASAEELVRDVRSEVFGALEDGRRGEIVRDGYRAVIAGAPNAGKSSLLNALAKREVAIVSPEAGTTRDVIEVGLDLCGLPVSISDTAGIRADPGGVEGEGIRRAIAHSRAADLVIWLVDACHPCAVPPDGLVGAETELLIVLNKSDLVCHARPPAGLPIDTLRISARTGLGLERLVAEIGSRARRRLEHGEPPLITRARHREALVGVTAALDRFLSGPCHPLELRAEDLRSAAHALGRITGRVNVEDVLDRLFATFCIGK